MSAAETSDFNRLPHSAEAIALRLIDDEAKVAGLETPGLDAYEEVARRVSADRLNPSAA